jgi:D-threo-aldose 1-dehydrogenase
MSPATALPRREIRRTGVHLTTLGFGAAPVAGLYHTVDEQTARAAIDAAWQGGIRYLDTAPHYGLGLSERRLGKALRDRPRTMLSSARRSAASSSHAYHRWRATTSCSMCRAT